MWHTYYIDAPAFRYYDADLDGNYELQYFIHDANYNVTALIDTSGAVLERYEYTPYGQVTILDANFADDADNISDYEQDVLFQGTQYDAESGLNLARYRHSQPVVGTWGQRDPAGYVDGMSMILFAGADPISLRDPSGLAPIFDMPMSDPNEVWIPGTDAYNAVWGRCSEKAAVPVECWELIDRIRKAQARILERMKKYNPYLDFVGGWIVQDRPSTKSRGPRPMRRTRPGSHFAAIVSDAALMTKLLAEYFVKCRGNNNGPGPRVDRRFLEDLYDLDRRVRELEPPRRRPIDFTVPPVYTPRLDPISAPPLITPHVVDPILVPPYTMPRLIDPILPSGFEIPSPDELLLPVGTAAAGAGFGYYAKGIGMAADRAVGRVILIGMAADRAVGRVLIVAPRFLIDPNYGTGVPARGYPDA